MNLNMRDSEEIDYRSKGQKIKTREKLSFGLGVLGNTIVAGIVSLYLLDYYINEIKLNLIFYVIANTIFLFYNAINDVIFGFYADRTKHRLGRRIPYIRYGAVLFGISFILFWIPFPGYNDPNIGNIIKFVQLLIAFIFFDTMFTIVVLSIVALPPEMSESTKERTSISLYNTIFTLIGGLAILIVPFLFDLGLGIFRVFILIMGALAAVFHLILSYGVKERKLLHEKDEFKGINFTKEIMQTFKNRSFVSFLVFNFSVVFLTTLSLNYAPLLGFIFRLDGLDTIILLTFYGGYIIALPFYYLLIRKIEMRTLILSVSIIIACAIILLFIIDLIFKLTIVYLINFIIIGIFMALTIFYYPFISDTIDYDELNTNRRREGIHFGMNALITKPAEQLPAIIGGLILILTNYQEGASALTQPETAIWGLKILVTIIPLIFAILGIISQLINPLKGVALIKMKEEVLIMHEEKERNQVNKISQTS